VDKLAAFATLHAALASTTLLAAPIVPFLAEMLWERLIPGVGSVHTQRFPTFSAEWIDVKLEASMDLVTRIVEMGRALRERAGIKIRQPLRAIHVRSSDPESLRLLAGPFASEQVLGELNIRAFGSLAADDGRLCSLKAKANFKTLGKRLGARMKAAAGAIEALPLESVADLRAGREVALDIGGERIALAADDVQISVETQADFDVETDGRFVVFLDTELDEGLIAEGLAREVVNRVNGLRKESGLAVDERIRLSLRERKLTAGIQRALSDHREMIQNETLAVELTLGEGDLDAAAFLATELFDLGQGRGLVVGMRRA
jgi:isoleucyl-tRNA synthetase